MDRGSSAAALPSAAAAGARLVASAAGRARLPPVGPARHDAVGRRGAATQDCARAGSGGQCEAAGPQALHPGRAHTGLHLDDVRTLCRVLDRLVDAGHTVLVIEHHLDVVKRADWIIEMGPGAGDAGGRVVAQGTPEDIARIADSPTGRYLLDVP